MEDEDPLSSLAGHLPPVEGLVWPISKIWPNFAKKTLLIGNQPENPKVGANR